jgi:hypothetical protein
MSVVLCSGLNLETLCYTAASSSCGSHHVREAPLVPLNSIDLTENSTAVAIPVASLYWAMKTDLFIDLNRIWDIKLTMRKNRRAYMTLNTLLRARVLVLWFNA